VISRNDADGLPLVSYWSLASSRVTIRPMRMSMMKRDNGQIVETAREARQGERGPSIMAVLVVSTTLATIVLAIIWFVFFLT